MTRIPQQEIDDLKQRLSLADVATSQGHKLKKQGADSFVCLCPFHQEKTPSCTITPSKNLFHGFGCGASGSVLDWLIKTEQAVCHRAPFRRLRASPARARWTVHRATDKRCPGSRRDENPLMPGAYAAAMMLRLSAL